MTPLGFPIRETKDHGAGIGSSAILREGKLVLFLHIKDRSAERFSLEQANAISQATFEFFTREFAQLRREIPDLTDYGVTSLELGSMSETYRNAFKKHLGGLTKGIVDLSSRVDSTGRFQIIIHAK